jgi:23S rRNA-/tRNA-specific pseudouridylate synthase
MSKKEHMVRALLRKCHRSNSNNNNNNNAYTHLLSLSQHSPISSSSTPPYPEATQQAQGTPHSHKKTLGLIIKVTPDEDGMRLDRFIRHRLAQDPHRDPINNNTISKWIRKREIELVIPLSTNATHTFTSNQDTQLVTFGDPSQSHIEESVGRKRAGERTRTFATSSTRTEAGQLWRIRPLFDPKVVEKVPTNGVEQTTASLGTCRVPHSTTTSTTPIPATDCLPLRDWVVYEDERIFIINKPSGIPVQGGTGVTTSIASSLSGRHIFFSFDKMVNP